MKLPSATRALAIATTSLAVLAGGMSAADTQNPPLWDGLAEFSRFSDASYYNTNVSLENRIEERVEQRFGLPEIAETYPLTSDGASIVVYYDPNNESISYTDENGQVVPSTDDAYEGSIATVVFNDGQGFGYIIGAGVITDDEIEAGADISDISNYRFYTLDFMANNEGSPNYVVPSQSISDERRAESGIQKIGEIEIGGDNGIEISVISGAAGSFMQVADPRYTMFLGRLQQDPGAGNDIISSVERDGRVVLASASEAQELVAQN